MRQFNCVSLLLLLGVLVAAAFISSASAATARRGLVVAATGDQGLDQARRVTMSILTDAPEAAAKDVEETTGRSRRRMDERLNYRRFGSRNLPSSQAQFGVRIPFTSDYGRIKRHPPKHN